METYQCTLSESTIAKAQTELHEPTDNNSRIDAINELRSSFKTNYPECFLMREDDKFFLMFLRARKFNLNSSLDLLHNYHVQQSNWPEFFRKVNNLNSLNEAITAGVVWPLCGKAKNSSAVVVTRFGKDKVTLIDGLALFYFALEKMLEYQEENQINGFIIIHDLAFAGVKVAVQINSQLKKKVLNLLHNALPIRLKKVIMVNQPFIFTAIFNVVKSLLPQKTKERVSVCGNSYNVVLENVDKGLLPKALSGSAPDYDATRIKFEIYRMQEVAQMLQLR